MHGSEEASQTPVRRSRSETPCAGRLGIAASQLVTAGRYPQSSLVLSRRDGPSGPSRRGLKTPPYTNTSEFGVVRAACERNGTHLARRLSSPSSRPVLIPDRIGRRSGRVFEHVSQNPFGIRASSGRRAGPRHQCRRPERQPDRIRARRRRTTAAAVSGDRQDLVRPGRRDPRNGDRRAGR